MNRTVHKRLLYQREYPMLLTQLKRLVVLARTRDPNIAFIALFGSVARLEPGRHSDTDVLILVHDQSAFYAGSDTAGAALLWMAYQGESPRVGGEPLSSWPVTAVVSDPMASDLDADLLANIARDGIELFRQKGYTPPVHLAQLTSLREWQHRIRQALAADSIVP